jgi:sugar lactone lactonase YvrE
MAEEAVVPVGAVTTLAGSGNASFGDGQGAAAQFRLPWGVAVDGEGTVYVADHGNHRIRKITAQGAVTTLAGSGNASFGDGQGTEAHFNKPTGVAVDGAGTVYVGDHSNHRIRKITAQGAVTTLAGSGSGGFCDGQGTEAHFNCPIGVAVDGEGTVYVADGGNHRIRKITAQGAVTTLAGSGNASFGDGQGTGAHFHYPTGVAVDGEGTVYVADGSNHRIRKITAQGAVTTLAGSGSASFGDGQGTGAHFHYPRGVAVDGEGTVYVADHSNHRIRKITAQGAVTTLAGSGSASFTDGQGTGAHFSSPMGVAISPVGNLLVADHRNHRIRCIEAEAALCFVSALPGRMPSSYTVDMRKMLADETLSDVTFVVDGERITAHRCICAARCEYFSTLLTGQFREGSDRSTEVPVEEASATGFRALLDYLYTDQLDFEDAVLVDLMRLAHRYGVERLYGHCVRHSTLQITTSNAVGWFIGAHEHGLEELQESTFSFISRNFRRIRSEAKQSLQQLAKHPELMMQVMMGAM